MSQIHRRSKKEIEECIKLALDSLIPQYGFNNITILKLAKEANIDHNIIYRKYGTLENLFEEYVKKYDFWLNNIVDVNMIHTLGDRKFLINLLQTFYIELEKSEIMQKVLIWELEDVSTITRRSANLREALNMSVVAYIDKLFAKSSIDMTAINTILVAGAYYLVLHRKISTFCGIDYNSNNGRKRGLKALESMINLLFDKLEEEKRLKEGIKMMLNDGIESSKIIKYLSLTTQQFKKLMAQ